VSKLKTPHEKKLASLALDGRNVYGENDKSSRKAIPLRKQLSHQALRRASKQPLSTLESNASEDNLIQVQAELLANEIGAKRQRFRKRPDESLGAVLQAKLAGNQAGFKRKRK
jgi:hypothetical protein